MPAGPPRRLGKGALREMPRTQHQVAAPEDPAPSLPDAPTTTADPGIRTMIPIDSIDPSPWNPRTVPKGPDAEDQSLTANIAQFGVLQNLLVRPLPDGRYQLIFGERRLRSARAARLTEVPATVRQLDDHEARVLTVAENLHRKQLHFLDEATGVAALIEEHWTVDQVAAKLGKPLSWVARRRRLLNLTPAWRQLAAAPDGRFATWGDRHFEQIAILEATAQDELLSGEERYQVERCTTVRELARWIGSRTRALSSFPWPLDDADLDPVAGACSTCPHRSSHHPGLFDDQQGDLDDDRPAGRTAKAPGKRPGESADRCLNPTCATKKGELLVERKRAQLAAKHRVVLLDDGYHPHQIPGALRDHQVAPAKKGTPGAVAAVVASGPHLGQVKWVKPRQELGSHSPNRPAGAPPQHKTLAERQEQKWRQRKVHAIGLLKTALLEQPPPPLLTSVRLAVVFGTAQRQASSSHLYDVALPRVTPGIDPAEERRRMLAPYASTAIVGSLPDAAIAFGPSNDDAATGETENQEGQFWRTFDALEGQEEAAGGYLWARTLAVMLERMTPNGDWRHVTDAWHEAERVAALVGLQAQEFLDQATAVLPDPKSWAKEQPPAPPLQPAAQAPTSEEPPPPAKAAGKGARGSHLHAVPAARKRPASRLPR